MTDSLSEKQLENYYRNEPEVTNKAIVAFLRDSRNPRMIVFGTKAVNAYLPSWLDKETKDWDIVSVEKAEEMAGKLERILDKRYGGDFFGVEPAIHPGTFRIRSKVTGVIVADISLKDRNIDFRRLKGVNYATLDWLENEAERLIANPEAKFRRSKDKDTLQRIRVHKRLKSQRRSSRGGSRYIDGSTIDTSMRGLR